MRYGIYLPPIGSLGDLHPLVDLAVAAEELAGTDVVRPHPGRSGGALSDAWVALSAIATSTSTIRLGPLVTPSHAAAHGRWPGRLAHSTFSAEVASSRALGSGSTLGLEFGSF